jgi:hypothetical protein
MDIVIKPRPGRKYVTREGKLCAISSYTFLANHKYYIMSYLDKNGKFEKDTFKVNHIGKHEKFDRYDLMEDVTHDH